MASDRVDDDVRAFLRQYIESYEQLEALLFLHRAGDRFSTVGAVADALGVSVTAAAEALDWLEGAGLLAVQPGEHGPTYSARPADLDLRRRIALLARLYEEQRLEIARLMSAHAIERVRTAAIRTFADAFLLGRKKRDG